MVFPHSNENIEAVREACTVLLTVVHSAVFAGHLVYACVVVVLIFRNGNSLIMRRELTP